MRTLKLLLTGMLFVTTTAPLVQGQQLGEIPAEGFQSPEGDRRFTAEAGVKPLNNLVFELLNRESPGRGAHTFRNPRSGWLYIRLSREGDPASATVRLDDKAVALKSVNGSYEAMVHAKEGTHSISLDVEERPAKRLEVRAVGELVYATYGLNPHISETGIYTWEYLRAHVLDHYNSVIGESTLSADGTSTQEAELREWTSEGKRWFTREPVPYDVETAEAAYKRWAGSAGMRHPLMSGIWADEFGVGSKYGKKTAEMYPVWNDAIRKLRANSKFSDRMFYAYGPSRMLPDDLFAEMKPFVETMVQCGYAFAPEWYITEGHSRPGRIINETNDLINEFSPGWEMASRESFERKGAGAAASRVIVVGVMSEPGWESSDLFPDYNFNVFLDAQMQFIATDPAFFGVRGIQSYLSGYCGEEQTRLFAKLIRHYAIEGNTRRFLDDPYLLKHIENGDFTKGEAEWSLQPAVADGERTSIKATVAPGFGTLEARYHSPPGTGDTALWTRRSDQKPNVVSQPIRDLTPGKLYSLRFLTGDLQELKAGKSVRRKHAVSKSIDNVEIVESKCFQAMVDSGFWSSHGEFNARNPYCLNYHQVVFRARDTSSTLRLTDWESDQAPGGPAGEELLWNFLQLQPYYE